MVEITVGQLKKLEWSGVHKYVEREGLGGNHYGYCPEGCPACGNWKPHGHKKKCWIKGKLDEIKKDKEVDE